MKLTFIPFTPGEVADATGVSLDQQNNLRRHGYIPRTKGHARFTLLEMARLFVFGMMSERGIGPKVTATFADAVAQGILISILWRSAIYSETAARTALKEVEEEVKSAARRGEKQLNEKLSEDDLQKLRGSIAKAHLVELVEAKLGIRGASAPNHFVFWANEHPEFFYGEDHPFGDCDYTIPAWQGPAIMFSIGAVGMLLASKLPHPAVTVEEEES